MSDINALGFGRTVDMLSNGMSGADMEHAAIASNVANVNTPNYHRQDVSFKDALIAASGEPVDSGDLALKVDDARQFDTAGAGVAAQPFTPTLNVDNDDKMRPDGSNVDIDAEMARLSENSGYSQTLSQLLQVQFMRLREAITEQTR